MNYSKLQAGLVVEVEAQGYTLIKIKTIYLMVYLRTSLSSMTGRA